MKKGVMGFYLPPSMKRNNKNEKKNNCSKCLSFLLRYALPCLHVITIGNICCHQSTALGYLYRIQFTKIFRSLLTLLRYNLDHA